jgi:hypothetical protein
MLNTRLWNILAAYRLMPNDNRPPAPEDAAEAASYIVHITEIGVQV